MLKPLVPLLCTAFAVGVAAFAYSPQSEDTGPIAMTEGEPVLLELFTSQGCSSCPPADRLAARFAQETGLVVVSRPVTYWDRLGWKDTLAREENTTLQRQYARRGLSGRNGVYTPQVVVDGRFGAVGSQENSIRRLVNAARADGSAVIRTKRSENGDWTIGLGGKTERTAELALLAIDERAEVAIGRGENSGREITYANVLRDERVIAQWNGGGQKVTLGAAALQASPADRYALVLREPDGGKVLTSRWLK